MEHSRHMMERHDCENLDLQKHPESIQVITVIVVIVSPVDLPVIVADCKSIVDDLGVAARVKWQGRPRCDHRGVARLGGGAALIPFE